MRLVLAHGCFDILHIGHVLHLRAARKLGTHLIVSVTPDRFVDKGPDRPIFGEELRADVLRALRCVDAVVVNAWPTAVEMIKQFRPAVYVKGGEYRDRMTPMLQAEKEAVELVGGRLEFTDEQEFHSTDIMRRIMCQ